MEAEEEIMAETCLVRDEEKYFTQHKKGANSVSQKENKALWTDTLGLGNLFFPHGGPQNRLLRTSIPLPSSPLIIPHSGGQHARPYFTPDELLLFFCSLLVLTDEKTMCKVIIE